MAWHYVDTVNAIWTNTASGSNSDQIDNATEMWNYFRGLGYSEQATSAIIGNAQYESTLNPAQWEYGHNYDPQYGYGLFQWTPSTRYTSLYCGTYGYNRVDGQPQCAWVDTQTIGGLDGDQWIGVTAPYSWNDFKTSTYTPTDLAYAFCRNWERGGWNSLRATNAEYWYQYFTGTQPPTPPDPPPPPPLTGHKSIPVWLMIKIIRDRQTQNGKKRLNSGFYLKW